MSLTAEVNLCLAAWCMVISLGSIKVALQDIRRGLLGTDESSDAGWYSGGSLKAIARAIRERP